MSNVLMFFSMLLLLLLGSICLWFGGALYGARKVYNICQTQYPTTIILQESK